MYCMQCLSSKEGAAPASATAKAASRSSPAAEGTMAAGLAFLRALDLMRPSMRLLLQFSRLDARNAAARAGQHPVASSSSEPPCHQHRAVSCCTGGMLMQPAGPDYLQHLVPLGRKGEQGPSCTTVALWPGDALQCCECRARPPAGSHAPELCAAGTLAQWRGWWPQSGPHWCCLPAAPAQHPCHDAESCSCQHQHVWLATIQPATRTNITQPEQLPMEMHVTACSSPEPPGRRT